MGCDLQKHISRMPRPERLFPFHIILDERQQFRNGLKYCNCPHPICSIDIVRWTDCKCYDIIARGIT